MSDNSCQEEFGVGIRVQLGCMFAQPKKSLGQNFLKSPKVLRDFIVACDLSKDDTVLEVGAGTGAVTTELAKYVSKVIAVEFDRDIIPLLLKATKNEEMINKLVSDEIGEISVIEGDILKILNNYKAPAKFKIVGSIPYSITSPLLAKIYELKQKPILICLIVQWEVAKKICAKLPSACYLSNLVATFGEAKIVRKISPGAFYPAPRVNSAILKIVTHNKYLNLKTAEFSEFLHKGFKHPRKKIKQVFSVEELSKAGVNANLRPSNLSLIDWFNLFNLGLSHTGLSQMG